MKEKVSAETLLCAVVFFFGVPSFFFFFKVYILELEECFHEERGAVDCLREPAT